MRSPLPIRFCLALALLAAALLPAGAGGTSPGAPPPALLMRELGSGSPLSSAAGEGIGVRSAELVVHGDRPAGEWDPARFTNLAYAAGYGATTAVPAEQPFRWLRATQAVAYVRCATWLGDGIAADTPEGMAGASVYTLAEDGRPAYEWARLTRALDVILSSGARPVLVLGGVPDALAEGEPRYGPHGAAVNRPDDLPRYRELVRELARHLIATYGAREVRQWYFEVWHAPDHADYSQGGRQPPFTEPAGAAQVAEFHRLYEQFEAGLRAADRQLRAGGPGTWGDRSFLRRFLEQCARAETRLDFISWQARGTVEELAAETADLRREIERDFPALKEAELLLGGWSGPPDEPEAAALGPLEAARLVALADRLASGDEPPPRLFRWGTLVAEEFDTPRPAFVRLGAHTAPLPLFRAMQWLNRLGPERVEVEAADGVGVLAARGPEGGVQALVYRLDETDPNGEGAALSVRLRVRGLPERQLTTRLRVLLLDGERGHLHRAWAAAGKPVPAPERLVLGEVGAIDPPPLREAPLHPARGGEASVELELRPNAVALVLLGAEPPAPEFEPGGRIERVLEAEAAYYDASTLFAAGEGQRAEEWYRNLIRRHADTFWAELALASLATLYDQALRRPAEAEATLRELLERPLDDVERLRALRELLPYVVRRQDLPAVRELRTEIDALRETLDRKRARLPKIVKRKN